MKAYRQQGLRNREARRARIDAVNAKLAALRAGRSETHAYAPCPGHGRGCATCGRIRTNASHSVEKGN